MRRIFRYIKSPTVFLINDLLISLKGGYWYHCTRETHRQGGSSSNLNPRSYFSSLNDVLIFQKVILDSINRKISMREKEKGGLLLQGPTIGNTVSNDQAARTGQTSESMPSAVDELEWSLLLCGIRSSNLPGITNVDLPRASIRARRGQSFVTDELERLFLLYNPAASGSTSTSGASDYSGQIIHAPHVTSMASLPGHLSPAPTPLFRRHTWGVFEKFPKILKRLTYWYRKVEYPFSGAEIGEGSK